ncbi:uroporphyrinogen-III C-methyltransferase [Neisseria sp.]|uniref:uroporphyrinogen-III C-methyltransferase n=1 Tax=Neisseria sp. TaxID=192066 RepID=UPI0035A142F5
MQEPNNQTPAAQPVVIKQSSGKGVALGALVLSLLALGAAGFLFVQGQNELKTRDLAVEQKLDKAALGESQNATLLQESLHRQQAITAELTKLASGQQQNSGQIASAHRAFQELQKGRVNWLVDETETMLNLASQQLLLSGNVQAAVGVLEHIESRLSRFDQPDLLPIKQAVSQDLTALKTRPYLDVSGTALRIDRLETAVAGLPLMVDGTLKPGEAAPVQQPAQSGSWWENAWNKTAETLKGLVEVRRLNSSDAMLMSPEQVYFVRENLRLRLLDARLALLQHNGEVYQSDLNNAEAAVKQYFDAQSPATQAWLKEIAALKTLDLRMISDDALKASLTAVNTYQEGRRTRVDASGFESAPAAAASAPAAASQPAAEQPSAAPKIPALPSENKAASGVKTPEPAKEAPKAAEKPAAAPAAKPASAAKPDTAKPAAKPENGAKGA